MALSPSDLLNVVAAAASSVGSVDKANFDTEVAKRAAQIITSSSPEGRVGKFLNELSESKPFVATILGQKIEPNTKRSLVIVKATPSDRNPDGIETIRTDIVDGNPLAEDLMAQVSAAKGQKALVYKFMEGDGDKKYRVLKAIQVIGADPEYDPEAAKAACIKAFTAAQK